MPLEEYHKKRDFTETREPSGSKKTRAHERPIFVVQEHHASILHYDFRLEADGVLKSWSVPKGPSMDPSVKRLAVQVEDHPIGYATFEGTIPQGQYGGGTVKIWDHGTYESLMDQKAEPQSAAEAIDAGRIEFVMHGERLKGKFALIRMKPRGKGKPQWLLMKLKDEFAEAGTDEAEPKPAAKPKAATKEPAPARASRSGKAPKTVELTHPDRVIYPEAGLTKADVFAYYEKIADRLLPFLKDRPITLERLPEGLAEKAPHFWQKDTPDYYPDWIPRIEQETEQGKTVHYALVNDRATLLYLVNQGTLTFHVWASRTKDLDRPDFVLFDLDPGKAPFEDVIAVARAIKATLDEEGADSFREDVRQGWPARPDALDPRWRVRRGESLGAGARRTHGRGHAEAGHRGHPQGEAGRSGLHRRPAERPRPPRRPALRPAGGARGNDLDTAGLEGGRRGARPQGVHPEEGPRPVYPPQDRPVRGTPQVVRRPQEENGQGLRHDRPHRNLGLELQPPGRRPLPEIRLNALRAAQAFLAFRFLGASPAPVFSRSSSIRCGRPARRRRHHAPL